MRADTCRLLAALAPVCAAACRPAASSDAAARAPAARPPPARRATSLAELREKSRVVLVTLDGVRWQEVFETGASLVDPALRPALPRLRALFGEGGVLFGDPSRGPPMRVVSKLPFSLPGYQAILGGFQQPCADNDCARIGVETLPEALRRRLQLSREQVAVFASWRILDRAAARAPEQIHLDVGDGDGKRTGGPPWEKARWDDETFALGLEWLERERPRFLMLALNDTDEWAHLGKRERYVEALKQDDVRLERLMARIAALPADVREHTTVLVTTDHGRGTGRWWTSHGRLEAARDVFLAASGPYTSPTGLAPSAKGALTHADVRPTIERLFGLCPAPCDHRSCGAAIPELVAGLHDLPDPCGPTGR